MFASARFAVAVVLLVMVAAAAWFLRASGYTAGHAQRDLQCKAEIAVIESRAIAAERQAQTAREAGRALADKLAAQAAEHQAALARQSKELHDEITRTARAGRVALDSGLTKLLNERAIVRESTGGDPAGTAAPGVASANAAPAGYRDGSASERSVARWIVTAAEMYETCRSRLHSLQTWARNVSE
jgi:hypothetical protein